jgi:CHAD domain-containing protein
MNERRAPITVAPTDLPQPEPTGDGVVRAPGFPPDDPFIVFAYATLAREVTTLCANRPQTETAPTPDEIHQLRVAARRLRVGLKVFQRMLPTREVARFRQDFRWFASSLGEARDLDVYTESFKAYAQTLLPEQRAELNGYELHLRRERADARHKASAALANPRTAALFDDAARFFAAGPSAGALRRWRSLTTRDGARDSIRKSAGRVRRLGKRLDLRSRPTQFHELRIKAKRLRYELEFFAEVYPLLKHPAKKCKALQELLGTHQDAYTATARLRRYASLLKKQGGAASTLPAALVQLRRNQLALARAMRRTFMGQWPRFVELLDETRRAIP